MQFFSRSTLLLLLTCLAGQAFSQTAVLLKDINSTSTGVSSTPTKGAWMGSYYYFTANDGVNGSELWKTDGTTANTILLKDINTGNGSSSPGNFAVVGSTLYFTANDGVHGSEVWKTDGTMAGTMLVKDIRSGSLGSTPGSLTPLGALLVFSANDGVNGGELWKTDGTTAGTVIIKEIVPGSASSGLNRITGAGNKVFFSATNAGTLGNYELYVTDGTAAGTGLVKEINPSATIGGITGTFYGWGNSLLFAADNGTSGTELWKSDGTTAGTVMIKDINAGSAAGNPSNFCEVNGKVFFTATDGNGTELWSTDGSTANTVLVKDIYAGSSGSSPSRLAALGNTLFFRANNGSNGVELWKSDGTAAGTMLVKDINPGSGNSNPDQLTAIGSAIYFQANDNVAGAELWKSDGTAAGTLMLKDINAGATASTPTNIIGNGVAFMFSADNGINGSEIWTSDGTAANTQLVKNINPETGNSDIDNLTALGSKVVFSANDGSTGNELWVTDGTSAGTLQLADINTATVGASGNPMRLTPLGNQVIFTATATGTTGNEVYKTDGTPAGTGILKDINPGTSNSSPRNYTEHNGMLYFSATESSTGNELWRTDGTTANTVIVKDIVPGTSNSSPGSSGSIPDMVSSGSMLFFSGIDQTGVNTGWELFGSTGAIGNGGLIKDINTTSTGANSAPGNFAYPGTGNTVYFTANDGVAGEELWKSDGTSAGTVMVKDITTGAESSDFGRLTTYNGKVYFTVFTQANGVELWQTDGSSAGTILLKDINPGAASADPQSLTVCGGYLWFSATNGSNGRELWRTDGTVAGTIMVADIVTGSTGSNPANFFWHPVLQTLFFSAYTPANGVELWEYDGTTAKLYSEVVPGAGSSNPGPIMMAGNNLVFVGTNGTNGLELYDVKTYNVWAGTSNSSWNTAGNWKKNLKPGITESAFLPPSNVITEAALDINATVVRLEIAPGRILTLNSGRTLTVTELVLNNGTIKGTGTLANANFTNAGTIAPGNSPGILNLTGNFTNQGILQIEIGGLTAGTGYDRLAISGTAALGGTLDLLNVSGFSFAAGQTFTVLTASAVSGSFATVNWPAGVTGTVNYTATAVEVNIVSALPLKLVSFTGRAQGTQVKLNWKTANEINTSRFEVERSADATNWSGMATIAAFGYGDHAYATVDANPLQVNYYRLKMTDADGKFTYSNVINIAMQANNSLVVGPVPAVDNITIMLKDASLKGQRAGIYNSSGAKVADVLLQMNTQVDVSAWSAGMYTIKAGPVTYQFLKR